MAKDAKSIKRFISFTIAILLMVSMVPMSAFSTSAAVQNLTTTIDSGAKVTLKDNDGNGYYDISNANELYAFAALVNSKKYTINAELTKDIVVNQGEITADSTGARVWKPIGYNGCFYQGSFNGNYHTISGLYYNDINTDCVGLFGALGQYGEFKNTSVIDVYFNGHNYVGVAVGYNNGKITDVNTKGINDGFDDIGGVAGYNNGKITNCSNKGTVEGKNACAGGIVGLNDGGSIEKCYNENHVVGVYYVGGVVGENSYGTITNCYNDGLTVCSKYAVGGVVGGNCGIVTNCYNDSIVRYSDDYTDNSKDYSNGIAGNNLQGTIKNCYYLDVFCKGGIEGKDVKGSAEATTLGQFESGEIAYLLQGKQKEHIWGQKIGTDDYPVLGGDKVYTVLNSNLEVVGYSNTPIKELTTTIDNGKKITIKDIDRNEYYEISNADELYAFAALVNSGCVDINAELIADIVVNEGKMTADSTDARVWIPIGITKNKYRGAFNGNNHTISGLYFNDSEESEIGFFKNVGQGVIENTGIINSYFNGKSEVGGLVAIAIFSRIENCYNTSEISGTYSIGGIAGDEYTCKIINCYNTGTISGTRNSGGVVGFASSGYEEVTNCYNTGTVNGGEHIGGVVGLNRAITTNCYNVGTVNGECSIGGIAGYNYLDGVLQNSYNIGEVSKTADNVGSVLGFNDKGKIENCYYLDTDCNGGINGENIAGLAEAKTNKQFESGEIAYLLQGEQENHSWGQKIGTDKYPVLGGDKVYTILNGNFEVIGYSNTECEHYEHYYENGFCKLCGACEPAKLNSDGVYEISNAGQLYWFADKVNNDNQNFGSAKAILTKDIVVNQGEMTADSTGVRVWTPIGNNKSRYTGVFDGNNHTISGLYFNSETFCVGLFGCIDKNSEIKNTGVINSYFNGKNEVGGIVGQNYNGTITNCYNTGIVSGIEHIGGLIGTNNHGTIVNSFNTGNVIGNSRHVGGVVGLGLYGTLKNCYNTGNISGSSFEYVGGVVGHDFYGTLENCYNTGNISGNSNYVGGVVGFNASTLINCYNTGTISGSKYVGGVVGENSNGTTKNCYYLDKAYTGGINGKDVAGSAEVKTAEQFASGEVAYLLQGEQEDHIWGQKIGTDKYPVLNGDKVYQVINLIGQLAYSNTDCKMEDGIAQVGGYSISLDGNIALKYNMLLSDQVLNDENAKMVFTLPNNSTVEVPVSKAEKSGKYYVFTCEVEPMEMSSVIKAQIVTSNMQSEVFEYSVKQCAESILANPETYSKEQKLVKAMLNYGAYVQLQFDYKTDDLANDTKYLTEEEKIPADVDLSSYAFTMTGEQEGVKFYGRAVSLDSKLEINLYFEINKEIAENLEITVNGQIVEATKNGKYYEVKISDILAQNLSDMYEIKVGGLTINCGVYSYGNLAMSTNNELLKNTIKALYAYNQALVEYKR